MRGTYPNKFSLQENVQTNNQLKQEAQKDILPNLID